LLINKIQQLKNGNKVTFPRTIRTNQYVLAYYLRDLAGDFHSYYNNTLNKLTKANKLNTTQCYVYDYQGNRVRSVVESNNQVQSQRDLSKCNKLPLPSKLFWLLFSAPRLLLG
jgi:hypothetical protein